MELIVTSKGFYRFPKIGKIKDGTLTKVYDGVLLDPGERKLEYQYRTWRPFRKDPVIMTLKKNKQGKYNSIELRMRSSFGHTMGNSYSCEITPTENGIATGDIITNRGIVFDGSSMEESFGPPSKKYFKEAGKAVRNVDAIIKDQKFRDKIKTELLNGEVKESNFSKPMFEYLGLSDE